MKQIVDRIPPVQTFGLPSDVNPYKYYGVSSVHQGKGYITQDNFEEGDFKVMCLSGLTRGNSWLSLRNPSLPVLIERCLQSKQVFEFNTPQELAKWLSE